MLKAIHAQEDKEAALEKAAAVAEKLLAMRLSKYLGGRERRKNGRGNEFR